MDDPPFILAVEQEKYLPLGTKVLEASVTVTAANLAGSTAHAEILILDCSASMQFPSTKLIAARQAAAAAIELLPDGVAFAVVKGTDRAELIYPPQEELILATAQTRAAAIAAIDGLEADGGTAMGSWLRLARRLFADRPDATRHAILLTDGANESESGPSLESALDECEGLFVCDACGVGDGWDPAQLTRIATVLRGSATAVVDPAGLPEDFRRLTASAIRKSVPALHIRIQTMPFSRVHSIRQVHPEEYDLTDRLEQLEPRLFQLATGSWAAGDIRSYHLRLQLDPPPAAGHGQDRQVAVVRLHPASGTTARAVIAHHTDKPPRETAVTSTLRHYSQRAELTAAINAGAAAHRGGDRDGAEREWGRAHALATELGDVRLLGRLERVITVTAGGAELNDPVSPGAVLALLIDVTIPSTSEPAPAARIEGAAVICPVCQGRSPAGAVFCSICRNVLATEAGP
ncbi:MAG TPA: vWA domain-containing protein [Mycobacteriales bacterium]|nr:vWA domain-containing protein [Mycobacteriales bacterium]